MNYKVTDESVKSIIELVSENIEQMVSEYKYIHKMDVCVPAIEVYPIAEKGLIMLFRCADNDNDCMGSVVVINDEAIFTSYGNDSDLLH